MKRRTHKRKHVRHHKKTKAAAKHAQPRKSHRINGDKYLKNKVLVFKLRKQMREEIAKDDREIRQLQTFVRRARRFAA